MIRFTEYLFPILSITLVDLVLFLSHLSVVLGPSYMVGRSVYRRFSSPMRTKAMGLSFLGFLGTRCTQGNSGKTQTHRL